MDQHKELVNRKLQELSDVKQKKKKPVVYNENQDEDIIRAQINRVMSGPKHIMNITMIILNVLGLAVCVCQLFNRCLDLDYIFLLFYFVLAAGPQIFLVMRKRFPSKLIGLAYIMYAIFYLGGAALIIIFFIQSIQGVICKYEICHELYGGAWIKKNYRESSTLCRTDHTKQYLKNQIIEILAEYQNHSSVTQYDLNKISLINFTSFYVIFSVLILAKIVYAVYLIIYFVMILYFKKKHPQLFKKINKDIKQDDLDEQINFHHIDNIDKMGFGSILQ